MIQGMSSALRRPTEIVREQNKISFQYPSASYSSRYLEKLPYSLDEKILDFAKSKVNGDKTLELILEKAYVPNEQRTTQFHLSYKTTNNETETLKEFFMSIGIVYGYPSEFTIVMPKLKNSDDHQSNSQIDIRASNSTQ